MSRSSSVLSFSCSHALHSALAVVCLSRRGRNRIFLRSPHTGTYVFLMESTKFPHSKFYTHGDVNARVHIMLHAGSSGMQAGAFSLVAGLSDAMMRSCLAAPSVRAEQWSRSADRAAEGMTSRSVSLVELLLRLQAHPPHTHTPAVSTYNGKWEVKSKRKWRGIPSML